MNQYRITIEIHKQYEFVFGTEVYMYGLSKESVLDEFHAIRNDNVIVIDVEEVEQK